MTYLRVKNLDKHQHYKDRRPPWIKLHAEVLDDYAFGCLQDASKAHLMLLWVLASRMDNRIPNDAAWIARKIGATEPVDVAALVSAGFIEVCDDDGTVVQDASAPLAPRKQTAMPETETETEGETETAFALAADAAAPSTRREARARPAKARRAKTPKPAVSPADVRAVLDHYGTVHPRSRPHHEFNERKVRARLADGFTVADLCDAIDGNAADPWCVQQCKTDLEYAIRPDKIQGHIQRAERARLPLVNDDGELTAEGIALLRTGT